MAVYKAQSGRVSRIPKRLIGLAVILLVIIVAATIGIRQAYYANLKPVSSSPQTQIITVQSGASVKQIAALLHSKRLIKSDWAFEWYVHSKELANQLQAGTYALAPDQDVPTIVGTLTKGQVSTQKVTIVPGTRLDQVRAAMINSGFTPAAVDKALQPDQYSDVPVLAFKPANITTLEGLLYPDTYFKSADTDPSVIVRESLVEMGKKLTPDMQAAFASEGLSPYQGIIVASIVEQEVSNPTDKPQVAQVFLKRFHSNMPLGSDVTYFYSQTMAKLNPGQNYDAYDTTSHPGLPPSPISTVSESSLAAVAHPANTDWLYFVTGDDGTTHYATTLQDHQANVAKYCHKLCPQSN
ncbi:MAG TPA: endolytic transglycosylase MltG [Candidatus Saccharimonadales bacterium]|nr:endolytic transglycosylase MltG [Candidatus Saccharimonadales bacterium]